MSGEGCVFCEIKSEPKRVLKTGKLFTSFLSNPRLTGGHSLVIPNRHVENITELTPGEAIDIFTEVQRIASKLLGSIALGVDTWTKTRPAIPESDIKVHHVHLHVIPSNPTDELYSTGLIWTADRFNTLSELERDEMVLLLSEQVES